MSEEPRTIEDIKGDITAVQNGGYPWGSYDDVTRFAAQCHRDRVWLALEHACLSAALAAAEVTRDRAMSDFDALALEYHKLSSHLQQSHAREAVLSATLKDARGQFKKILHDRAAYLVLAQIGINEIEEALSTLPRQASAMMDMVKFAKELRECFKWVSVAECAPLPVGPGNKLADALDALSALNPQEGQQ